jgi:UDP-N-acetylmuramate: L-alanyl-gamma-D-glutamyl-meso-diaminopimelate ligase
VLAVAGTHGKTTTASMLAWILEHAGLRPAS